MPKTYFITFLFFSSVTNTIFAQSGDENYKNLILKADSLYFAKEYLQSAKQFSTAFAQNNDRGLVNDRYNAACSWALSNNSDSAFYQLFRIAEKGNFKDYFNLTNDPDLKSLHIDKRWQELVNKVKANHVINNKR